MVEVFARAKSKPEHVTEVRDLLRRLVGASRAESGVLLYELFESPDSGEFLFREQYADEAAFESHKASRHMQVYAGRAMPLLEEELNIWTVKPVEPS